MPRNIQAILVNTRVKRMLVPPKAIIVFAMVRPKPVLEHTPMIIPTQAQAIATDTVCFAPLAKASTISFTLMRVSFFSCATTMVTTMVNTAE